MSTLKDVARLANVSTATVSRIINGKGEAGKETIDRVNRIVKELNYQPNSIAKTLSVGHSNLIALLLPNLKNPFFSELAERVELAANKKGYQLYLCNSQDDSEKVSYYLNKMQDQHVMGAIINSLFVLPKDLEKLESSGIATITIDRTQSVNNVSSLRVDNQYGGYLAAKHLIKNDDLKNILFLSGPKDEQSSQDRLIGVKKAISELNHNKINLEVAYGDFIYDSGYQVLKKFLRKKTFHIDGILSSNDAMALGAIRALADYDILVPEDVRVIGYDNTQAGQFSIPRLSTIEQFNDVFFDQIIDELISIKNQETEAKEYLYRPRLIQRESTKERRGI